MTEFEMKKQVQKAKRFNYTVLAIIMLMAIFVVVWTISQKYNHTFSTSKWIEYPNKRVEIVDDMLAENVLIGKTAEEIFTLLGQIKGNDYVQNKNTIVYYLGDERGLISIDSEWLILTFKDGLVSNVSFKTD